MYMLVSCSMYIHVHIITWHVTTAHLDSPCTLYMHIYLCIIEFDSEHGYGKGDYIIISGPTHVISYSSYMSIYML